MTKKIIFGTIIAITLFAAAFLALAIPNVQANHGEAALPDCESAFVIPDPNIGMCVPPEECEFGVDATGSPHCNVITKEQQEAVDKANEALDTALEKIAAAEAEVAVAEAKAQEKIQKELDVLCEKIQKEIDILVDKGIAIPPELQDLFVDNDC